MVFSGLVTACRLATCPTRRSPPLVMATTLGVVRAPSWLGMTTGSPPCITATTELVVPKSIVAVMRSEEHTSELQSHSDLVCRLLLEKKKNTICLKMHVAPHSASDVRTNPCITSSH